MKILSAQQMQELDAFTVRQENITSAQLMERAAQALKTEIVSRWDTSVRLMIFAGPGNNGGDALALARLMIEAGYVVETFLINPKDSLSADCDLNKSRLETMGAPLVEVKSQFEPPQLTPDTLVIDGLFGTGLNKPLTGGFASLVKFINNSPAQVVSIDMPSGLMCEDNVLNVRSNIICADLTLTFHRPKLAMLLPDNQSHVGEVKILDIGLSESQTALMETPYQITEMQEVPAMLRPRAPFGHKGTFGHALLIAGSYGMAGAAILAAKACLRGGVGKVTVRTPLRNNDILQVAVPEAVLLHDKHAEHFAHPVNADSFDALAIGPGIGTASDTALAFIEQVRHTSTPLVIDADGINILGGHKGWIQQVPKNAILTPHPAEFRRIGNKGTDDYSMLLEAKQMALTHKFYIIVKGHRTAICTPEGQVYFNPTGNSGMATAGSGDVLTGLITALLAQGYPHLDACRLGVYLHGFAGDMAAAELGEESVTANDLLHYLALAFRDLWAERRKSTPRIKPLVIEESDNTINNN